MGFTHNVSSLKKQQQKNGALQHRLYTVYCVLSAATQSCVDVLAGTHGHGNHETAPCCCFSAHSRRPIKSSRWQARPRLYLTNEGWLSGWQTLFDDQLHTVASCTTWDGANMTPAHHPTLPAHDLHSLPAPKHPRIRRLIITKETRVQRRSILCTLSPTAMSHSLFVTPSSSPNKWEHVPSLASLSLSLSLSALAQNGFILVLLPPQPHLHSSSPLPSCLLSCFFSHSRINWFFWLPLLSVLVILHLSPSVNLHHFSLLSSSLLAPLSPFFF